MKTIWILFLHEIRMRLRHPRTSIVLAFFLFLSQAAAFTVGDFLDSSEANLLPLFLYLPLMGAFFLPLLTMSQWAQPQALGALPWLFSFPIPTWMLVVARFAVGCVLALLGLLLTLPLAASLAYLGNPDWGMIQAGYLACFGIFISQLALGGLASALAPHELAAYVLACLINLFFLSLGSHLLYEGFPNLLPGLWSDRLGPVGSPYHLLAAFRGVIDLRDVFYWTGWTILALIMTIMVLFGKRSLHQQAWKDLKATFSVLFLLLFTLLLVLITRDIRVRWDLTQDRLYTLSGGTRGIVNRLQHPVSVAFYMSRSQSEFPQNLKTYGQRIEEFLREYAAASGQKFRFRVIDAQRDSEQEQAARAHGLVSLSSTQPLYFGMILRQGDKSLAIPYFDPLKEDQLEYDITEAIVKIQQLSKPVLGIMSDLPLVGDDIEKGMRNDWAFVSALRGLYQLVPIPTHAQSIPEAVQILLVVQPQELSVGTEYALDQFLLKGGSLVLALDAFCRTELNYLSAQQMQPKLSSHLDRLFSAWGLHFSRQHLVGDSSRAGRTQTAHVSYEYPFLMQLQGEDINGDHMVSKRLRRGLSFLEAGWFELDPKSPYRLESIVKSSAESGTISTDKTYYMSAQQLKAELHPDGKERVLAALLTGRWQSAFKEAPPGSPITPHVVASDKETSIFLLSDVDFLSDEQTVDKIQSMDQMILKPKNDNLTLILNALEFVSGHQDLIAIRSRGRPERLKSRIRTIQDQSRSLYSERDAMISSRLAEVEDLIKESQTVTGRALTAEHKAKIDELRREEADLRRQRRQVRSLMDADLRRLESLLQTAHLLLLPLLVLLIGFTIRKVPVLRRRLPL